jgi:hypothetical protein
MWSRKSRPSRLPDRKLAGGGADGERLGHRLSPRLLDGWCGCRADAERAPPTAHERDDHGNLVDAAQVERRQSRKRRREMTRVVRAQVVRPLPVEERKGEPCVPREHECVALDQLEQRREQRASPRRRRGESVARRIGDLRLVETKAEVDELRRQPRVGAVAKPDCRHPAEARVGGEGNEGEPGGPVLLGCEECERLRGGGGRAELARGRLHEHGFRHVGGGIALERLADRRRAGRSALVPVAAPG